MAQVEIYQDHSLKYRSLKVESMFILNSTQCTLDKYLSVMLLKLKWKLLVLMWALMQRSLCINTLYLV